MQSDDNPQQSPPDIKPVTFDNNTIEAAAFTPSDGTDKRKGLSLKPLHLVLLALLLCGAAAVWFLFTAKSVIVKTTPQAADITITGGMKLALSDHYVMREGTYQIEATYPGYYPLKDTIAVGEAQNQIKAYTFKKLPGQLTVAATDADSGKPITGQVLIDGEPVGNSNVELADIAAGEHTLTVKVPRYFDFEGKVDIEGMSRAQTEAVTLKPAWADITLNSAPQGATVSSGDEVIGQTPLDGTLLEGEHQLTVSLAGYKTWTEPLTVKAGDSVDLPTVYLDPSDGKLQISSNPTDVSVTVDGQYKGNTPLELMLTADKRHTLVFFKDGYRQQQQNYTLASGDSQAVKVTLSPQLGQVTFNSNFADALLYVDGRLMGRANQSVTLTARQHDIVIKKDGYVDYQTTVLPRADLKQIVDVQLRTYEQAKWDNIPTMLQTQVGAKLKLFRPDDVFTMGASRREQGRRANETSRRVKISKPFYVGMTEISNDQFRKFSRQHSSGNVKGNSLNGKHQPVVNVSWTQAALFCNWLSAKEKLPLFYQVEGEEIVGVNPEATGYRLPTEAEWAWLTRYQDGEMLKYSWGKQLPPMPNSGNFADRSGASILGFIQANYNDKYIVTSPVASFPPNGRGLFDLSGNAAEWMHDFYEVKTGLSGKIDHDPMGGEKGDYRVIRGSSWAHGTMTELRLSFRDYGLEGRNDVGFRIARYVD